MTKKKTSGEYYRNFLSFLMAMFCTLKLRKRTFAHTSGVLFKRDNHVCRIGLSIFIRVKKISINSYKVIHCKLLKYKNPTH